jgi:hypothetical protein
LQVVCCCRTCLTWKLRVLTRCVQCKDLSRPPSITYAVRALWQQWQWMYPLLVGLANSNRHWSQPEREWTAAMPAKSSRTFPTRNLVLDRASLQPRWQQHRSHQPILTSMKALHYKCVCLRGTSPLGSSRPTTQWHVCFWRHTICSGAGIEGRGIASIKLLGFHMSKDIF